MDLKTLKNKVFKRPFQSSYYNVKYKKMLCFQLQPISWTRRERNARKVGVARTYCGGALSGAPGSNLRFHDSHDPTFALRCCALICSVLAQHFQYVFSDNFKCFFFFHRKILFKNRFSCLSVDNLILNCCKYGCSFESDGNQIVKSDKWSDWTQDSFVVAFVNLHVWSTGNRWLKNNFLQHLLFNK